MFNLIARYPEGKLHPYAGAGAGYGYLEIYDIEAKSAGNKVLYLSGDVDNVFAYQFLAGLNFDITKNWFLGLGYKYFHPDRVSYGTSVNGTSVTSPLTTGRDQGFTDADYQSHNIVVTIGYLF
jgi:opacity protein-like surface antigen